MMSGMFRNTSLLKTRLPGLLPKVVWMPVRMACVAINSASSMKSFALVTSRRGSPCRRVRRTFPTIWCIRSQIASACGFLLDAGASLILHPWRRNWNSCPTNSPPLSCTQRSGQGYLDNQTLAYFLVTYANVFSSIQHSSTRLEYWIHIVLMNLKDIGHTSIKVAQRECGATAVQICGLNPAGWSVLRARNCIYDSSMLVRLCN